MSSVKNLQPFICILVRKAVRESTPLFSQMPRSCSASHKRNAPVRDNIQRAPRKCWYCPENWVMGNKCLMQRALNAFQMQGNSDDEEDDQVHQIHNNNEQLDLLPPMVCSSRG